MNRDGSRLPLQVSPFLRPFRRGEELLYDNGITATAQSLPPLADALLRAMWNEESAASKVEGLVAAHGDDAITDAIAELIGHAMLFEDRAAADAALTRAAQAALQPLPFVDQIELTNKCPMRCGFCPRGISGAMTRPTGRMELDLFARLLAQLHPAQSRYRPLELHHLGESLLHPEVVDFVTRANAHGLPTEMSVNPSLLSPELGRGLLDGGLRRLVVSLDGMDDSTLAAIRGPAAQYQRAADNLDALLAHLATSADPPIVVIQMIDLERNRHQRQAFLERWTMTELPTVHTFIKDLDGLDPDTGTTSAEPLTFLCTYPFRSVVILWDGRVVPCCRDADADLVLGDLNDDDLATIWNGAAARELRARHLAGDLPDGHLCHRCPWRRDSFAAAMPRRHPDRATANPLAW